MTIIEVPKNIKSISCLRKNTNFKIFCILDAIREMRKYSDDHPDADGHNHGSGHLDVQMQAHLRLFRAQRNFYISGFSLFLCL